MPPDEAPEEPKGGSSGRSRPALRLRAAGPADAPGLAALAERSHAYWGYDEAASQAEQPGVRPEDCDGLRVILAELDGVLVGWYRLAGSPPVGRLAALFVDPSVVGRGVGALLVRHARGQARWLGFERLLTSGLPKGAD